MSAGLTERYLDLSLGRCRYLEGGQGAPVIVLHGMGAFCSADNMAPLVERLARDFSVIAPDLLGFGKGVRELPEGPTFDLVLEHLRELLLALDIKRARWVGHSLGGWLSTLMTYQSPHLVERLVLLCAAGMNKAPAPNIRMAGVPTLAQVRTILSGRFRKPVAEDDAVLNAAAAAGHHALTLPGALTGLDPFLHQMETPVLRERYLLQRRLPLLSVPTLMAFGEGDVFDPYPTWNEEWDALAGDLHRSSKPWTVPGARFARLPTGHFPHIEAPEETAALVREFLQAG